MKHHQKQGELRRRKYISPMTESNISFPSFVRFSQSSITINIYLNSILFFSFYINIIPFIRIKKKFRIELYFENYQ